jgi:ABC-type transport system substrate-binding protein
MRPNLGGFAAAYALSVALAAPIAEAQKSGGILIMSHFDSPASMSMHEEATGAVNRPMMGVFNNLVMFDQRVAQNSMASIVPDLATGWSWNEEGTELTLPLHRGVRWHDGKPFTAKDVKCTWDLLTGRSAEKLRLNPRKTWYSNLAEVTANGDNEVTFRLKRPQPSFLTLLASGWSPVYPCHVLPRDARPSNWHWPVQIRRVPAKRADPSRQKPGVLETGPAVPRWHRLADRPEPGDPHPRVRRRQFRSSLPSQQAGTEDGLATPRPPPHTGWRVGGPRTTRHRHVRRPRGEEGASADLAPSP